MSLFNESSSWLLLVHSCGEEGRIWADEYKRTGCPTLTDEIDGAVGLLRRREIKKGREALERNAHRLRSIMPQISRSTSFVLERWRWSAVAYLEYCCDHFANAKEALNSASDAAKSAIQCAEFLALLAYHFHDFQLQYARICRSEQNWSKMKEHIETGRAMLEGRLPLCVLSSGAPLLISEVEKFYKEHSHESYEGLGLLDVGRQRHIYESFVRELLVLPGFVIPYP